MIRKWINRICKAVFVIALVIAIWDFRSVYLYEQDVDVLREKAYESEKELIGFDLAALKAINPDCVGYISIMSTPLNYPVMQGKDFNETYYLDHDFYGNYHGNGTPFVDIRCDVEKPSDNLIIYAHNTRNSKMFSILRFYKEQEYFEKHPVIRFDHAGGGGNYKIFAVLFSSLNEEENRNLFKYIEKDPENLNEWESFLQYLEDNRIYSTGVEVSSDDEIIMLSTCYRQIEDGRVLVFARKARSEEA